MLLVRGSGGGGRRSGGVERAMKIACPQCSMFVAGSLDMFDADSFINANLTGQ